MDQLLDVHRVRVEGDILHIQIVGDFGREQMGRLLEMIEGVIAQHGRYGTIIDTRKMGKLPPDARSLVSDFKGATTCYGNAIFGESFTTRVAMTMALQAIQFLSSQKFTAAFFKDEPEARAWLERRGEAVAAR
jgi:hypothetical protein